mgnify:FL=1|jgi:outer membrane receptor protein involved in Fe transport
MNIFKYLMSLLVITSFSLGVIAQEDESDVEEVVVTGSKIKSADLYSFAPVTEVTAEDIAISGKASIGEILAELPSQGSGLSRTFNNGGEGSVRIDMRNLGSGRTLILVDGKRWVNSGRGANSSVDLNSIPTALVERVEILRDGASAVYGSDAIAGVVNIITKDTFSGGSASFQTGEYVDGGAETEVFNYSFGASNGNTSFMGGVSLADIGYLSNFDRPETAAAPGVGSSGTPQGRFAYSGVVGDCSNFTVSEGTGGTNPATDFRCWVNGTGDGPDGGDRFNYNPYNYVEVPSKRANVFAKMTTELNSGQTVGMMVTYQKRDSDILLAPTPLFYGFQDYSVGEGIGAGNPYNPFGIEFCDLGGIANDGRTCDDETLGAGNYAVGWFGRRMLEAGGRNYVDAIETFRGMLTLEGSAMGFDYSAFLSKATNNSSETTDGLLDTGAIRLALASNCGPDGNGVTCLNIFGGQGPDSSYDGDGLWSGSGSITPAMVDAISFQGKSLGGNDMTNYGVDFTGELFVNPQGFDVPVAFGYEHRSENGFNSPDAFIAKGLSSGNASQPVSGGFTVDEFYAEAVYQVHSMLQFTGATRFSDYNTFGDTTNSKVAMLLTPMDGLTLRASFAEGFRAPSIGALYSGNSDSYPTLQDPCDVNSANFTGNADGTQTGQCLADGVPTGFTQPNDQIRVTVGGNPLVQPEESESFNAGMVYQSEAGWTVFADFYDIEITNLISSIGSQLILNGCYNGTDPSYCSLVDRTSSGFVDDLRNTTNNVGMLATSGLEFGGSYDLSTPYGDFAISSEARMLDNYDVTQANGDVVYNAGFVLGGPRDNYVDFKMNTSVRWTMGNMFASATFNHYGEGDGVANAAPTKSAATGELVTETVYDLDAVTYLDLQYGMVLPEYDATLRVGLDNALNEDPPFFPVSFANDFDPMYRTWGSQSYYMNVSVNF